MGRCALRLHGAAEFCKARTFRLALQGRLDRLAEQHIQVAGAPEQGPDPAEFLAQLRQGSVGLEQGLEQADRSTQPPQGDTRLVHAFDFLADLEGRHVERKLVQAGMGNGGEGLASAHVRHQHDRGALDRLAPCSVGEAEPAFALADQAEPEFGEVRQIAHETEDLVPATMLQFDFEFVHRHDLAAGTKFTGVERHLDFTALEDDLRTTPMNVRVETLF